MAGTYGKCKFDRLVAKYENEIEFEMMNTDWSIYSEMCRTNHAVSDFHLTQLYNHFLENNFFTPIPNIRHLIEVTLIIPATSATCERSFSKLKLIETFLRSTMSQERLSDLAIMNIERKLTKSLNIAEVID